ncbi:MAG: 30S ribosomal protein S8 [Planctomycetes bacterium RBG_13_62_9]|nr:MAG: 30S ribosomal protein S8 [Planctomycetes bacterium RBG_13_62_9]
MSLSDPIADMLTRIRNAVRANKRQVNVRASRVCEGIAAALQREGYIEGFDRIDDGRGKQGILRITLKYDQEGRPAISDIKRMSKPGCRMYASVDSLPKVMGGMGVTIVSTSKGIISDRTCRENKVGGEVLCTVS